MDLVRLLGAAIALLVVAVALGVVGYSVIQTRARARAPLTVGPGSSNKDLARYKGWDSKREAPRPTVKLRHYQYLAAGKIDRLYDQVAEAGLRPTTTTHLIGSASVAQVTESSGPASPLTTMQKLAVLRTALEPVDINAFQPGADTFGSEVLVSGTMQMKHAVLPVNDDDETATQAVWLGRLESGRFICLGGSAANMGSDVPRGGYVNSGVAAVLLALDTASEKLSVRLQPADAPMRPETPVHMLPGAWDAEVVDVWMHLNKLHTHHVTFLAYVMTSSRVDVASPRYDVLVGSPLCVEFN